tara:strand:- start:203 stop:889 length:687 start_codon:yes stop_codon:yes gene_type:complete
MSKFEAIILCGGKGSRVSKFTKQIPKCLININGKPFLYYQLKLLKKNNINDVIISVGYLSEKVRDYIKNNIDFINIKIKDDGKRLLGTGGAVLKSINYLKKNFFIIYGDSYFNFKLKKLVKKKNLATMAIFKNNSKYDKSNIELKNSKKILYHKNRKDKKLQFIDYGASYINKQIFEGTKKNVKFDLSELFEEISKNNMLSGYKVKKRFYEIGSYDGIKDFKNYLKKK